MGLFTKLFRREKLLDPLDLSVVKTDLHSHLIPGIDDGADTVETSLELIKGLKELGYQKIITTPHVMGDYYKNTSEIILTGLKTMQDRLKQEGVEVELQASAEYYLDDNFTRLIEENDLLPFGDNFILFELPFVAEPQNLEKVIFDLQLGGYRPILAHPERYTYWYDDKKKCRDLLNKGLLFQLNVNSLSGHYSPATRQIAIEMIEQDMFRFIGSDTHHMGHVQMLGQMRRQPALHKLIEGGKLLNSQL